MPGVWFQCRRCGSSQAQTRATGWLLCDRCWNEEIAEQARRDELAARVKPGERIVGEQPKLCEQCSQPFMAADAGTRFCSSKCRARAWRAARRTDAEAARAGG